MVRRSVLFAPGDSPEIMRKAAKSDVDVAVFDFEDAVAPANKAEARRAVADVLADLDGSAAIEHCVRVNSVDRGPLKTSLPTLARTGPTTDGKYSTPDSERSPLQTLPASTPSTPSTLISATPRDCGRQRPKPSSSATTVR